MTSTTEIDSELSDAATYLLVDSDVLALLDADAAESGVTRNEMVALAIRNEHQRRESLRDRPMSMEEIYQIHQRNRAAEYDIGRRRFVDAIPVLSAAWADVTKHIADHGRVVEIVDSDAAMRLNDAINIIRSTVQGWQPKPNDSYLATFKMVRSVLSVWVKIADRSGALRVIPADGAGSVRVIAAGAWSEFCAVMIPFTKPRVR